MELGCSHLISGFNEPAENNCNTAQSESLHLRVMFLAAVVQ